MRINYWILSLNDFIHFLKAHLFICKTEVEREEGRKWERESKSEEWVKANFFPRCLQQPGLGVIKPRSQQVCQGSPCGWEKPKYLILHLLPTRHVNRIGSQIRSRARTWTSTLMWYVDFPTSDLAYCVTVRNPISYSWKTFLYYVFSQNG